MRLLTLLVLVGLGCVSCRKYEGMSGFPAELRLVNTCNSDLVVTPIGSNENRHACLCLLPVFQGKGTGYYSLSNRKFELKAHSERSVWFDYDDVQFAGIILVESVKGSRSVMVYEDDLSRTDCCRGPSRERYPIDLSSTGPQELRSLGGLDMDDLFEWFNRSAIKDALLVSNMAVTYRPVHYANRPNVVRAVPGDRVTDVDPGTTEIVVSFDQDMMTTIPAHWWLYSSAPQEGDRMCTGTRWTDSRTCMLSVTLGWKWKYEVELNRPGFWEFRSLNDVPSDTQVWSFETTMPQPRPDEGGR